MTNSKSWGWLKAKVNSGYWSIKAQTLDRVLADLRMDSRMGHSQAVSMWAWPTNLMTPWVEEEMSFMAARKVSAAFGMLASMVSRSKSKSTQVMEDSAASRSLWA